MYESFGAQVDGRAVEFRLFFPDATVDPTQYSTTTGDPHVTEVRLVGDFQGHLGGPDWDWTSAPVLAKTDHPSGVLYRHRIDGLPDGFYQYKSFVAFDDGTRRWCGDPCARYVPPEARQWLAAGPRPLHRRHTQAQPRNPDSPTASNRLGNNRPGGWFENRLTVRR